MPISDRKIFTLWRKRMALKDRVTDINKEVKKIDDALIAEFERRGIKSLTEAETGERITYVAAEHLVYDQDALREQLSRSRKGKEILARCTKEVLDMRAVAAEVQAGNIPPRVIAASSSIKRNAPYLAPGGRGE